MYSQNIPLVDPEWDERMHDRDARFDSWIPQFLDPSVRRTGFADDHYGVRRPAIGWRILRTLCWIFAPVLIGIGAALAWQSYDGAARDMIVGQLQSLGGLLSPAKPPPAMAATAPDTMQQLEPLAYKFEVMRRSVEQLAAKQDQMAESIVLLQAVADDIREKISTAPSSPSQQQTVDLPQRQAPQPKAQSTVGQSSSVPRSLPAAGPSLR
jgi:hypothetical protein